MATRDLRTNALRTLVIGLGLAAAAVVGFGYVSVNVSPWLAGTGVAVLAAVAYGLASDDDEVSISFAFSIAAVGMLVIEFVVPDDLVAMLPIEPFIRGIDATQFAVLVFAVIAVWWIIDERFLSSGRRKPKPDAVAERVAGRFETLIEQYLGIGKVVFALTLTAGLLFLNTFVGPVIGELADIVVMAPYAAADVFTIGLGYLALGGDVPILNSVPFVRHIGAQGFLLLAVIVLALAVGVDFSDD